MPLPLLCQSEDALPIFTSIEPGFSIRRGCFFVTGLFPPLHLCCRRAERPAHPLLMMSFPLLRVVGLYFLVCTVFLQLLLRIRGGKRYPWRAFPLYPRLSLPSTDRPAEERSDYALIRVNPVAFCNVMRSPLCLVFWCFLVFCWPQNFNGIAPSSPGSTPVWEPSLSSATSHCFFPSFKVPRHSRQQDVRCSLENFLKWFDLADSQVNTFTHLIHSDAFSLCPFHEDIGLWRQSFV